MSYGWGIFLLITIVTRAASQVTYDVTCSAKEMRVSILLGNESGADLYVQKFKGFEDCLPKTIAGKSVFKLPLDNFHLCGTTRMTNKYTGHTMFYNRIIIEKPKKGKELILVKCLLAGDKVPPAPWEKRPKRNILPPGFLEAEDLNITQIVAHAPTPYLNLAIRQHGRIMDITTDVKPGEMLEMLVYLDSKSSSVYGILASYLKVTDGTPDHDEVIVMNGCSIDPYIFGNFEVLEDGKTLSSKFRAFKFPDTNYVLFVGTVNICLQECRGVQCGNNHIGYGRKKREIPAEMPFDPNKLYEVEMATLLKIQFAPDHFTPKRAQVEGTYPGIQTKDKNIIFSRRTSGCDTVSFSLVLLFSVFSALLLFRP